MGSNSNPQEGLLQNGRPSPIPPGTLSSGSGGSDGTKSDSFHMLDSRDGTTGGHASGPTSAASHNSALSFAMGLRQPLGSSAPTSAVGSVYSDLGGGGQSSGDGGVGASKMEREGSVSGGIPDLAQLSLEKGRPLDVEDLDDAGWRAVSMEKKVIELGSLGEGAGGAVTRCILKGGSTVFALKVRGSCLPTAPPRHSIVKPSIFGHPDHHYRPKPRR